MKALMILVSVVMLVVGVFRTATAAPLINNYGIVDTITFDEVGVPDLEMVTDQYQDFGVTFEWGTLYQNNFPVGFPSLGPYLFNHHSAIPIYDIYFGSTVNSAAFTLLTVEGVKTRISSSLNGAFVEGFYVITHDGQYLTEAPYYGFTDSRFDHISIFVGVEGGSNNVILDNLQIIFEPIPEPTTTLLLGSGLIGLAGFGRKFKK